jgi:3'(2'), 5'-bisphosphate nucleotidase
METMSFERELDIALEAVDLAGRAILDHYRNFEVVADAPIDISTIADREAQEIVLAHLHRAFPDDALCAEEETPTLADAAHTGSRLWIIDPIDGTRGFARKNGEFSVMVGFVHQGEIMLGIVSEPAKARLTYALRGGGCWRRDGGASQPVACRVTSVSDVAHATLTQSHSKKGSPPSVELAALKPAKVIETYSAGIKLAQVARGEADIYLNNYPFFHDWDICAGHILVDEAGGKATGLGGQTLRYGEPGAPQHFGLLATNGTLHAAALAALRAGKE